MTYSTKDVDNITHVKDAIHAKKPTIILGARFTGKSNIYNLLKEDLISQSEEAPLEIHIPFSKENPHIELKELLKTEEPCSELSEYFINSSLVKSGSNILIYLDKIEVLGDNWITWLLRNYINLMNDNQILVKLGITLVVEGTLTYDQIEPGKISPFPLELKFPKTVNEDIYFKHIGEIFPDVETRVKEQLWNITLGDMYFTDKLLDNIPKEDDLTINMTLDAINNYCKSGAYEDKLKWYILNAILELHEGDLIDKIDDLIERIENNWLREQNSFKKKCALGGIIISYNGITKFRSPLLIKRLYQHAIQRVNNLRNTIKAEITEKFIAPDFKDEFNEIVEQLERKVYFGFIENIFIGKAERKEKEKIQILGNFNHSKHMKSNWLNEKDLYKYHDAYVIIYDLREKRNSSARHTHFIPLNFDL